MYAEQDVAEDDTVLPLIYGDEENLGYAVKETYWNNLYAIPAATPISAAEFAIPKKVMENRKFPFWRIIGDGLQPLRAEFDYIIIDTRIFAGADEGDRVFFPQLNRAFKLDVRGEAEDDIFIKWEVSEVAP